MKIRNEQLHEVVQKLQLEKLEAANLLLKSQLELLKAQTQIQASSLQESGHNSKQKHHPSHHSSTSSKGHHREHGRRRHREDSALKIQATLIVIVGKKGRY